MAVAYGVRAPMELFFRKYFWTVNLAFLALAGLLAARTVNTYVDAALEPAVELPDVEDGSRPPPRTGILALSPQLTAEFFGITLPPPPEATAEPQQPTFDPNAPPSPTSLRASLIGTLVANRPEWSMATLRDDSLAPPKVSVYMPGDMFMGALVENIERDRVIILNGGKREYIGGGDEPPPSASYTPAVTTQPPAAPDGAAQPDADGITKLSENEFEIEKDFLDKQLANLNSIATQARIVPSFKDGQANGFKLFSIRPNSLYAKIGVQNGDVIRKINGYEINSPEKALEIYSKLKESSKVEIELERRGAPVKKSYTIKQ